MIYRFINNGSGKRKRALFEIAKKVKWFRNQDAFESIRANFFYLHEKCQNFKVFIFKKEYDASSMSYVSKLTSEGFLSKSQVIDDTNLISAADTILIIDDFVGTGNAIIKGALNKINPLCNVFIICHCVNRNTMVKLEKEFSNVLFIKKEIYFSLEYNRIIRDTYQINLIKAVCSACKDRRFAYGYGNLGLMITYEGVCPNNDISMLWYREDYKNPFNGWVPLLDRDINVYMVDIIAKGIKNKDVFLLYNSLKLAEQIDYKEFLVLIALRLNSISLKNIASFAGIDTIYEVRNIIKILISRGTIVFDETKNYDFDDKINKIISSVINKLIINAKPWNQL
ncbi:MAG: hypothetical protein PHT30_03950 [Bacilli bacterium]|nr:hypothetical protein [Bacilli bacterium]